MAPRTEPAVTPELLLRAYAAGLFPMAEDADDPHLHWVEPRRRGVIPLDGLVVPRRLARTVRQDRFEVSVDRDFGAVVDGCARAAPGRERTWISGRIRALYAALFARGRCRTVECRRDGRLVGGLYGVALGGAFFGESMFHDEADASKVALVHLVARLRLGGYRLLDAQFVTDHLASLGAVELARAAYRARLAAAIGAPADEGVAWAREPLTGATALAALAPEAPERARP